MGEKNDGLTVMEMKVDSDDRLQSSNTKTSTSGSMILRTHQCFMWKTEILLVTYFLLA